MGSRRLHGQDQAQASDQGRQEDGFRQRSEGEGEASQDDREGLPSCCSQGGDQVIQRPRDDFTNGPCALGGVRVASRAYLRRRFLTDLRAERRSSPDYGANLGSAPIIRASPDVVRLYK